jgi:hypothetical protein
MLYVMVATVFMVRDARAYIDPNSAGILYQILFPVVVAVTVAWRWIKEMCKQLWAKVTGKVIE